MKNYIFSCCALLLSVHAAAQPGFYLQPSASLGTVQTIQNYINGNAHTNNIEGTNYSIGAGYKMAHWQLATGISYLRTGYSEILSFQLPTSSGVEYAKLISHYHHIILPLTVGYLFNLRPGLTLLPSIGAEVSYNIDQQFSLGSGPFKPESKSEFNEVYHQISLWGTASLHVEYNCNKNFSVFAGPSAHAMFTNMFKIPSNARYRSSQRNYAYLVDAGVTWYFHKKAKTENAPEAKPKAE